MPLRDVCQSNLVTLEPNATLLDAARLMRDSHVGTLIVVEKLDGAIKPSGILTDRDIALAAAEGRELAGTEVGTVMSRNLRVASADDGIAEVTMLMHQHGVRRVPIVDDEGRLVGIVSSDDLFRLLAIELMNLSTICERQIAKESAPKALATTKNGWTDPDSMTSVQ